MDGFEATRKIKATEAGKKTAIIAITASAFEEDKAEILSCGCDGFVRKPFEYYEIFEQMKIHLGMTFEYAETTAESSSGQTEIPSPIDLIWLTSMPDNWRRDLFQASLEADLHEVKTVIQQIENVDFKAAQQLLHLAHQFRFDQIMSLLKLTGLK